MSTPQASGIAYEVIRSPRRATTDIIIERDGRVLVRAPEKADDDRIAAIVESKRGWIHRTLAEWRDLNAARVLREFKNGEGFLYLGRSYRLSLASAGEQEAALQLRNGRFLLRRDLVEQDDGETAARTAFRDFYVTKGHKWLHDRISRYAPKLGITHETELDVKELGHRWASCSPSGRLAFHWKCMMAPLTIIDYIVVHELCHFRHRNHSDAFWNEVDKILPNYRDRKLWLRHNGAALDL